MIEKIVDIVRSRLSFNGCDAIILGSGLGTFTKYLKKKSILPYSKIPDFPQSTVATQPLNNIAPNGEATAATSAFARERSRSKNAWS